MRRLRVPSIIGVMATRASVGWVYQYRHWTGSWLITPSLQPDHSTSDGHRYGFYDDVYVRTSDGWRIKERDAHSDPQPEK